MLQNADLEVHQDPQAIREALVLQLYLPVRWGECVRKLAATGATLIVEPGPGKVLSGLCRRIDKGLNAQPAFDSRSLDAALAAASEAS